MPTFPSPTNSLWPFVDSRGGFARSRSGAWYRIEGIIFGTVVLESDDTTHPVGSRLRIDVSTKYPGSPVVFSRADPGHRNYGGSCDRCELSELKVSGLGQLEFRGIVLQVTRAPDLLTGGVWGGAVPGGR